MLFDTPAWPDFFQKVKFNHVATATGAQHSRRPKMAILASEIEFGGFKRIREFIDSLVAIWSGFWEPTLTQPSGRE
jgi:hypothetical protein